jgi:oligosaccharide repeat unit polymerase
MIYILFILLISFAIFSYIIFGENILSPTVIATIMFAVSTFVAMINVNIWKFTIAPITVVVILTSLMAFGIGEFLVHVMYYNKKRQITYILPQRLIEISFLVILFLSIVLIFLVFHYYSETVKVAKYYGYTDGPLMLWYVRQSYSDLDSPVARDAIALYSSRISEILAYIFTYIFLYNYIFFKAKKIIRYIFPVLVYIPYIILTGGRTGFIILVTVWIIVGSLFFLQKNKWNRHIMKKIIIVGIIGIGAFFSFFIFAGSFRNSKMLESGISILSEYIGVCIPGLDNYIVNYSGIKAKYFGGQSFREIYASLRQIGIDIPISYTQYRSGDEITHLHGLVGPRNAATIIESYINDFGFLGLYILFFIWGYLFSFFFEQIRNKRNYGLIIYSYMLYGVTEFIVTERIFTLFFSSIFIKKFILIVFFNYLFLDKRYINEICNFCFKNTGYRRDNSITI